MSTVRLAQRTVLAICLSAWSICLPVLTASESCMLCSADYEKQCCCGLLGNGCRSSSTQQCNKCISETDKSEYPSRKTHSCPCCQYRSELVAAIQGQKKRTQREGGRLFVGLHIESDKLYTLLNVQPKIPITHITERSVDRCVCFCRLTI